jgi:hypothetical protein
VADAETDPAMLNASQEYRPWSAGVTGWMVRESSVMMARGDSGTAPETRPEVTDPPRNHLMVGTGSPPALQTSLAVPFGETVTSRGGDVMNGLTGKDCKCYVLFFILFFGVVYCRDIYKR